MDIAATSANDAQDYKTETENHSRSHVCKNRKSCRNKATRKAELTSQVSIILMGPVPRCLLQTPSQEPSAPATVGVEPQSTPLSVNVATHAQPNMVTMDVLEAAIQLCTECNLDQTTW